MWPKKKTHKPQVLKVWVLESKTKTDSSYLFFLYRLSFLFPSVHISTSPGSLGRADRNAVCKQSIEKPICHCKQREAQSWSLMQSDPNLEPNSHSWCTPHHCLAVSYLSPAPLAHITTPDFLNAPQLLFWDPHVLSLDPSVTPSGILNQHHWSKYRSKYHIMTAQYEVIKVLPWPSPLSLT